MKHEDNPPHCIIAIQNEEKILLVQCVEKATYAYVEANQQFWQIRTKLQR